MRAERDRRSYERNNPGGDRAVVPPDPIPNSEVKRRCADGSVGFPHVRVGHRQVLFILLVYFKSKLTK